MPGLLERCSATSTAGSVGHICRHGGAGGCKMAGAHAWEAPRRLILGHFAQDAVSRKLLRGASLAPLPQSASLASLQTRSHGLRGAGTILFLPPAGEGGSNRCRRPRRVSSSSSSSSSSGGEVVVPAVAVAAAVAAAAVAGAAAGAAGAGAGGAGARSSSCSSSSSSSSRSSRRGSSTSTSRSRKVRAVEVAVAVAGAASSCTAL